MTAAPPHPDDHDDSTVRHIPFDTDPVDATVTAVRELLSEVTTLLVIARYPEGLSAVKSRLTARLPGTRVETLGLRQLARRVHAHDPSAPTELSEPEANVTLDGLIRNMFGTSSDRRLRDAVHRGQGDRHIHRVIREALGQHRAITTSDDRLQRIETLRRRFCKHLDDRTAIVPPQLIGWATEALADSALRRRVLTGIDAVVVLDYEEMTALDRHLLDRLEGDTPVVTLYRGHAALSRLWNEAVYRPLFLPRARPQTLPAAIATYLATGRRHREPSAGHAELIAAPSRRDELQAIVDRVDEALAAGYVPDEILVAGKDETAGLTAVTVAFQETSVPTTQTVVALEDSGVIHEVITLSHVLAGSAAPSDLREHLADEYALAVATQDLCDRVAAADSLGAGVDYWVEHTAMRERLTTEARHGGYHRHPATHIRTETEALTLVATLADTIDTHHPADEVPWAAFARHLERARQRATPALHPVTRPHDRHGVTVVPARQAKYLTASVVIVQGLTHDALTDPPTRPRLWSQSQFTRLAGYPRHTTRSAAEIAGTFAYGTPNATDSHTAFAHAINRREFAVAAGAATDELVLTTNRDANPGGIPDLLETIQSTWPVPSRTRLPTARPPAIAESGAYV